MARSEKALLLFQDKRVFADGSIVQMQIWMVPNAVSGSSHRFRYSLFYGLPGRRIVLYDNERPKGDHRHYGEREEAYEFCGIERLVEDFLSDVKRERERG